MNILIDTNLLIRSVQKSHPSCRVARQALLVDQLERFFTILPDSIQAFRTWRRLVVEHSVIGAKVHDTRLVAMMSVYSISSIVTFNVGDFKRFPRIEAIYPETLNSSFS